jgi:hypothetical protein
MWSCWLASGREGNAIDVPVGGQVAAIVEQDDSVAQLAPALLEVVTDGVCAAAVGSGGFRTLRRMGARHECSPFQLGRSIESIEHLDR